MHDSHFLNGCGTVFEQLLKFFGLSSAGKNFEVSYFELLFVFHLNKIKSFVIITNLTIIKSTN